MKRLSLLFSLLLLCVGVAVADYTPTAETPVVGEKYALKVVSWGSNTPSSDTYLSATGTRSRIYLKSNPNPSDFSNQFIITLVSSSSVSGAYNIKINNLYFPSFKSGASGSFYPVTGKATNYDIVNKLVKVEGGYKIQNCFSTNNVYAETGYVTTNGTELQVTSNADNALIVSFEKIITINYTDNKNSSFSRDFLSDTETIDPTTDFYTNFTPSSVTLNNNTQTYSVTCDQNYPFEVSTADNKKWCYLKVRNDDTHYQLVSGTNTKSRDNTIDRTSLSSIRSYNENLSAQWAFVKVENEYNRFKIYNRSDETKVLYLSARNNMTDLTLADENTTSGFTSFYINPQPKEFTTFTGGFTIKPDKDETHAVGDHNKGALTYWSNRTGLTELNDNGSIFRVVNLTADCKNCIAASPEVTNIGTYSQTSRTTLATTTSVTDFFAKYDELEKNSTLYVTPSTTKLYRIQANRYTTPVYMSCNNTTANKNGEVQEGSGSNPDERRLGFSQSASAANLVQFESTDDGKFYIKDVNSGFYYGKKNDASDGDGKLYLVKNNQWAGKYSIAYSLNGNVAQVGLKENQATNVTSQYLYCSGSDATAAVGDNNYVQFHSPYTDNAETGTTATVDAGCVYKIAEVSTYPLTISDALYASLCLPFSVTLPEELKAYKVTSVTNGTENREMELTAIEGAIPANEPVIIGATKAGSFNLTINGDNAGTKSTDNWLTGATVKRTGIDEDYFALGYKALNSDDANTKTVGFYRVTTTTMPANKAYLLKSHIQESAANPAMMLTFNFGNITTDVNDAKANEAESSNTYYDLNGRRVLYPTHGIYIKGNGQKVFIQ